jgi:hypothetical protein
MSATLTSPAQKHITSSTISRTAPYCQLRNNPYRTWSASGPSLCSWTAPA